MNQISPRLAQLGTNASGYVLATLNYTRSGEPNRLKVGRLSAAQLRSIAETKMTDLNARDVEEAMKVIAGTARSMGVETP